MIFSSERQQLRQTFIDAWQKAKDNETLTPFEREIVTVIQFHPEYQAMFDTPDKVVDKDFSPDAGETNPFLHLSGHIGLHEQLSTNRPEGIRDIYHKLCEKYGDPHQAEHAMMECLMQILWQAQRDHEQPDETVYLSQLHHLLKD
ncbi:MAG: hypothetical protein DHS20C10_02050 [marine bacterium B5-7]|nr:MAG: hypothetical protein DHS20C10_02050 [marine bacterium B5-7]